MGRRKNQCNCENVKCPHGEEPCTNEAGKHKAEYVGAICDACAERMPKKYLKENTKLKESAMLLTELYDDDHWIVLGVYGDPDYYAVRQDYDELVGTGEEDNVLDVTDIVGDTEAEILSFTNNHDFDFIEDESHPFGGYVDVYGSFDLGAQASPDYLVMIPEKNYMEESKMNESIIHENKDEKQYGVFIYDEQYEGEEPDTAYFDTEKEAMEYAKDMESTLSDTEYLEVWKKDEDGWGVSGSPIYKSDLNESINNRIYEREEQIDKLKPIPGEEKYVEYDEEYEEWGVFGADSGFCYGLYGSESQAENRLSQLEESVLHKDGNVREPLPKRKSKKTINESSMDKWVANDFSDFAGWHNWMTQINSWDNTEVKREIQKYYSNPSSWYNVRISFVRSGGGNIGGVTIKSALFPKEIESKTMMFPFTKKEWDEAVQEIDEETDFMEQENELDESINHNRRNKTMDKRLQKRLIMEHVKNMKMIKEGFDDPIECRTCDTLVEAEDYATNYGYCDICLTEHPEVVKMVESKQTILTEAKKKDKGKKGGLPPWLERNKDGKVVKKNKGSKSEKDEEDEKEDKSKSKKKATKKTTKKESRNNRGRRLNESMLSGGGGMFVSGKQTFIGGSGTRSHTAQNRRSEIDDWSDEMLGSVYDHNGMMKLSNDDIFGEGSTERSMADHLNIYKDEEWVEDMNRMKRKHSSIKPAIKPISLHEKEDITSEEAFDADMDRYYIEGYDPDEAEDVKPVGHDQLFESEGYDETEHRAKRTIENIRKKRKFNRKK